MPTYEYQCTQCGHQLEAFQSMSEKPLTDCPNCHQAALMKLVSAAGFQLKGSGWYVTDYKGKAKPTSESSTSGESKSTTDTKSSSDKTGGNT